MLRSRAGAEDDAIRLDQGAGDGHHLLGELSGAENHLREAAPRTAAGIHARKIQIDETHDGLSGSIRGWRNIRRGIIFESRKFVRLEEFLRLLVRAVGEQGDTQKIFLAGEIDRKLEEPVAESAMPVLVMNDEVLEKQDETSLGSRDGEEEIDHREDAGVLADDKDAAAAGLLEDQAEPA